MDKMRILYLHTTANALKTTDLQPLFDPNHVALHPPSKKYTKVDHNGHTLTPQRIEQFYAFSQALKGEWRQK